MSNKNQNNISTILMFTDIVGIVAIIIDEDVGYNPLADLDCNGSINVVDIVSVVSAIIAED